MPDPHTTASEPPPPPGCPVPRWALHRRLYDWMLTFAHSPHATLALFVFSFTEAIFFPIPPIVLQVPLSLERRGRAWWYAGVTTAASVLGGIVGFGVGMLFSETVRGWFPGFFSPEKMAHFQEYTGNVWLLTGGAIAVHPYKLFTVAAGLTTVPFWSFIVASIAGRGVLFFGVGALLWWFGAPVKRFIERYFTLITVLFGVFLIGLVVLAKVM
ncbi:MAG: YqaA family protein [Phycisphaerales bacterium]